MAMKNIDQIYHCNFNRICTDISVKFQKNIDQIYHCNFNAILVDKITDILNLSL